MKYVKQYIKKLYPNVEISESKSQSNSLYFTINGSFKIRLSDHLSPVMGSLDLDIISLYGQKDDFILLYDGCRIPSYRNRKEVNSIIKHLIDYKGVNAKNKQLVKEGKEKKTHVIMTSYVIDEAVKQMVEKNTQLQSKDLSLYLSWVSGNTPLYKAFSKLIKNELKRIWTEEGIRGVDMLQLMVDMAKDGELLNGEEDKILSFIKCRVNLINKRRGLIRKDTIVDKIKETRTNTKEASSFVKDLLKT